MMGDLMRDHIGRREIALRTKALVQCAEKGGVEIRHVIRRAVKGAGCAGGTATGALGDVFENDKLGRRIGFPQLLLENPAPDLFCRGQHAGGEIDLRVFAVAQRAGLLDLTAALAGQ